MKPSFLKIFYYFIFGFLNRIQNSPTGHRLAIGIFWSMSGVILSRVLMFGANIIVARTLGKTGYGEFGIIQSTVGTFGILAGFGLGVTSTKHVAEFRFSNPDRAGRIISSCLLVAAVTGGVATIGLIIFAPFLATHTINAPHLVGILRISALMLFIGALNGAQTGALSGFEAFKTIAYINLLVGLISFPILVCGAWFAGLIGAVIALTTNLGINWLLNHIALRKEARRNMVFPNFHQCNLEWDILLGFSLPAVLSGALVGPTTWACNAMLVNQPGGYEEMGIFAAALLFQQTLLLASRMLNAPMLSMLCSAGVNVSTKLSSVNILSSWVLGVSAAIPLLCFHEIAQWLLGADFINPDFTITFSIVVFYTTIMLFKDGLARVLASNNLLWWGFCSNTIWSLLSISFALFFVRLGAIGLAISFGSAYSLNTIILVPLYYFRSLVPKGTLISLESATIWLVLTVLLILNVMGVSLLYRVILFIPFMLIAGVSFRRIFLYAR